MRRSSAQASEDVFRIFLSFRTIATHFGRKEQTELDSNRDHIQYVCSYCLWDGGVGVGVGGETVFDGNMFLHHPMGREGVGPGADVDWEGFQ